MAIDAVLPIPSDRVRTMCRQSDAAIVGSTST
jgi:hypothetical protein